VVSMYRLQASSMERRPPRTAATTWALRRITQRFVSRDGKSAVVSGLPSGPITYLITLRETLIKKLSSEQLNNTVQCYKHLSKNDLRTLGKL
jgi:hypothetical protein